MTMSKTQAQAAADPFLWLEERTSQEALDWVHGQNKVTVAELQGDPSYPAAFETALDLMTAEDNIAVGSAIGDHVYNFWQDKTNVLGLWRRTTVASYKTDKPDWETILDFDAGALKPSAMKDFVSMSNSRMALASPPSGDIDSRQRRKSG